VFISKRHERRKLFKKKKEEEEKERRGQKGILKIQEDLHIHSNLAQPKEKQELLL
jgi:hypothetical protein